MARMNKNLQLCDHLAKTNKVLETSCWGGLHYTQPHLMSIPQGLRSYGSAKGQEEISQTSRAHVVVDGIGFLVPPLADRKGEQVIVPKKEEIR